MSALAERLGADATSGITSVRRVARALWALYDLDRDGMKVTLWLFTVDASRLVERLLTRWIGPRPEEA